jgi:hypothetical protein
MYYEHKKHDGSLPLIGVNTFLGGKESHAEGGEVEFKKRGRPYSCYSQVFAA